MSNLKYSQLKETKEILKALGISEQFLESEVAIEMATKILSKSFSPTISTKESVSRSLQAEEYIKSGDVEGLKRLLGQIGISVKHNVISKKGNNYNESVSILRDGTVVEESSLAQTERTGVKHNFAFETYYNEYGLDVARRVNKITEVSGRIHEVDSICRRDLDNPARVNLTCASAVYGEIDGVEIPLDMITHTDVLATDKRLSGLLTRTVATSLEEKMVDEISTEDRKSNKEFLKTGVEKLRNSYEDATKDVQEKASGYYVKLTREGNEDVEFKKLREVFRKSVKARTNEYTKNRIGKEILEKIYEDYNMDIDNARKKIQDSLDKKEVDREEQLPEL